MSDRSVIDQIRSLRDQGFTLVEAKKIVHAQLSPEEQTRVEVSGRNSLRN